jgi:DNA-binding NarL/FixJ family response regulator
MVMDENRTQVVIADDHPAIRMGLIHLLGRVNDIQVVGEASNGMEAIELVKQMKPDVLILDLEMPVMGGLEAAQALAESHVPVKILIVSAYADRQLVRGALNNGAVGYLTKDEAPDMIVQAVRAVAQDQTGWFSEKVEKVLVQ